jgi:hypothetical protein
MEERTTKELIEILGDDYNRCHKGIIDIIDKDANAIVESKFEVRQLVRSAFAYIEAVTFSVKCKAAERCMDKNIPITISERYFAAEVRYDLTDKGEIIERPAQIRLTQNIRFAFNLLARANQIEPLFDPSSKWWSCLRKAIKVRDRLMHPRMPGDLDISTDELLAVMDAKDGFEKLLLQH